MSDYIKKVRTADGDKQIDFTALANLPVGGYGYMSDPVLAEFIPETSVTTADDGHGIISAEFSAQQDFTAGDTYSVIFDGTEYPDIVAKGDDSNGYYIGGLTSEYLPDFTNYPFAISTYKKDVSVCTKTAGTHTFSVKNVQRAVNKIDAKYLPDGIDVTDYFDIEVDIKASDFRGVSGRYYKYGCTASHTYEEIIAAMQNGQTPRVLTSEIPSDPLKIICPMIKFDAEFDEITFYVNPFRSVAGFTANGEITISSSEAYFCCGWGELPAVDSSSNGKVLVVEGHDWVLKDIDATPITITLGAGGKATADAGYSDIRKALTSGRSVMLVGATGKAFWHLLSHTTGTDNVTLDYAGISVGGDGLEVTQYSVTASASGITYTQHNWTSQ